MCSILACFLLICLFDQFLCSHLNQFPVKVSLIGFNNSLLDHLKKIETLRINPHVFHSKVFQEIDFGEPDFVAIYISKCRLKYSCLTLSILQILVDRALFSNVKLVICFEAQKDLSQIENLLISESYLKSANIKMLVYDERGSSFLDEFNKSVKSPRARSNFFKKSFMIPRSKRLVPVDDWIPISCFLASFYKNYNTYEINNSFPDEMRKFLSMKGMERTESYFKILKIHIHRSLLTIIPTHLLKLAQDKLLTFQSKLNQLSAQEFWQMHRTLLRSALLSFDSECLQLHRGKSIYLSSGSNFYDSFVQVWKNLSRCIL